MSSELQGYYYTFASLIGLQIFVELGLNFAVVQIASHEMAKLKWTLNNTLEGNEESKKRLQSLLHFSIIWIGIAAIVMIMVLIPIGISFFYASENKNRIDLNILGPWITLVISAAANLVLTPAISILEGCGKVSEIAILRICQSIFSSAVIWIVLSIQGELYALGASTIITLIITVIFIWKKYICFFKDLLLPRSGLKGMNWKREVWPFQWRISISWTSGYLVNQIYIPIIFISHGAVLAGQMGLTMHIFTAISGVTTAWITSKMPSYGQLIASSQRNKLDTLFNKGLIQSTVALILINFIIVVIVYYMMDNNSIYLERILPAKLIVILAIASLGNHIIFSLSSYLRAHKKEPFMILSVMNGIITLTLALQLIPKYGATGAVVSYVGPLLFLGLIFTTIIFYRKRKEWKSCNENIQIDRIEIVNNLK